MSEVILSLDSSDKALSVGLMVDGEIKETKTIEAWQRQSEFLVDEIAKLLDAHSISHTAISAVSTCIGPGSYTGLRIGLSEAKGLCLGLSVPLIGVNTLQLLVVSAMFANFFDEDNLLYVPMLDARRSEVYTAVYTPALVAQLEPQPMILTADSFSQFRADGNHKLVLMGNGSDKARSILSPGDDLHFVEGVKPVAMDMMALAEKHFREGNFIDVAYSTPLYLKDFQATTPKKRI